jgi:multidrug efflux pump subunit AcrA (membrane-fusion protein)
MKLFKIGCLLFLLGSVSCRDDKEAVYPQYSTLTESVYSSVIIEPVNLYKVFASTHGIVDEVLASEGDVLKRGDTILRIIDDPSDYQEKNAALELKQAIDNYEGTSNVIHELESELLIAQLTFENDSVNLERKKRLWEKKIGSQNELEQQQLRYNTSRNYLEQIRNQVARKTKELKNQVLKARNIYETNRFQLDEFVVRSNMDGKLYELLKERGERVSEQEPLAYIGSKDSFLIRMQVDEVDIVRVKEGQEILVSLDAYEEEVFEARVKKIIPKMNIETQTFWVEGQFKEVPEVVYSGLRGEANIIIRKKERVLMIPQEYLLEDNQVITKKGRVKVETGLKGIEYVEIIAGLDTSIQIIKP